MDTSSSHGTCDNMLRGPTILRGSMLVLLSLLRDCVRLPEREFGVMWQDSRPNNRPSAGESAGQSAVAGAVAGFTARVAVAPIDLAKISQIPTRLSMSPSLAL